MIDITALPMPVQILLLFLFVGMLGALIAFALTSRMGSADGDYEEDETLPRPR